jgi:hypothetical protein
LVADAPWNDEEMLAEVRRYVLPTMQKHGVEERIFQLDSAGNVISTTP